MNTFFLRLLVIFILGSILGISCIWALGWDWDWVWDWFGLGGKGMGGWEMGYFIGFGIGDWV